MPAFAFRKTLAALVLIAAGLLALQAADYRERVFVPCRYDSLLLGSPACGRYHHATPWWAFTTAVALLLVGVVASTVVAPRRVASSSDSWLSGFWSGRTLRNQP